MRDNRYKITLELKGNTFVFFPNQGRVMWYDEWGIVGDFRIKTLGEVCKEIMKKRAGEKQSQRIIGEKIVKKRLILR